MSPKHSSLEKEEVTASVHIAVTLLAPFFFALVQSQKITPFLFFFPPKNIKRMDCTCLQMNVMIC